MTADFIAQVLSRRHRGRDLFFTQVNTGRSQRGVRRFDALAIAPSWANPCFTGYEVKIRREDFLGDDKWPEYLPFCHRFYFACPKGLISPREIPDQVGLVVVREDGGWRVAKRAAYRLVKVEDLYSTLFSVVINRMDSERHPFYSTTREMLEAWLVRKTESRDLAVEVRTELFKRLAAVERDRDRMASELLRIGREVLSLVGVLRGCGVDPQLLVRDWDGFREKLFDEGDSWKLFYSRTWLDRFKEALSQRWITDSELKAKLRELVPEARKALESLQKTHWASGQDLRVASQKLGEIARLIS